MRGAPTVPKGHKPAANSCGVQQGLEVSGSLFKETSGPGAESSEKPEAAGRRGTIWGSGWKWGLQQKGREGGRHVLCTCGNGSSNAQLLWVSERLILEELCQSLSVLNSAHSAKTMMTGENEGKWIDPSLTVCIPEVKSVFLVHWTNPPLLGHFQSLKFRNPANY